MDNYFDEKLITADQEDKKEKNLEQEKVPKLQQQHDNKNCVFIPLFPNNNIEASVYYQNVQTFCCCSCYKVKKQVPLPLPLESYHVGKFGVWLHFCSTSCLFDFTEYCCDIYLCESRSQTLTNIRKLLNDPSLLAHLYWANTNMTYRLLTIPRMSSMSTITIQNAMFWKDMMIKKKKEKEEEEAEKKNVCLYCLHELTDSEKEMKMGRIYAYVVKTNQFFINVNQLFCCPGCLLGYYYYGPENTLFVPRMRIIQWAHKFLFYVYGIQHALPNPPALLLHLAVLSPDEFRKSAEYGRYYMIIMPNIQFDASIFLIPKPYWTRLCSSSSSSSSSSSFLSLSFSLSSSSSSSSSSSLSSSFSSSSLSSSSLSSSSSFSSLLSSSSSSVHSLKQFFSVIKQ